MTSLSEGSLTFTFPTDWLVSKYDDWPFYQRHFKDCCLGSKAVDFLAISPDHEVVWLIEVKDYRAHSRTKVISVLDEMTLKVKDTLAGLVASKMDSNHPHQQFASTSLKANHMRVVLHLEQPLQHSKLFPRAFNPANIEDALRRLLKPIDAHPKVTETSNLRNVGWVVH